MRSVHGKVRGRVRWPVRWEFLIPPVRTVPQNSNYKAEVKPSESSGRHNSSSFILLTLTNIKPDRPRLLTFWVLLPIFIHIKYHFSRQRCMYITFLTNTIRLYWGEMNYRPSEYVKWRSSNNSNIIIISKGGFPVCLPSISHPVNETLLLSLTVGIAQVI